MSQNNNIDQPKANLEILLRASEIARFLNVSRSLAYQLLQSGQIPTIRIGRSVRVRPQDLNEFIHQNITQRRQQ